MPVTPAAANDSMQRSQRTGEETWPTRRSTKPAPDGHDAAVAVGPERHARVGDVEVGRDGSEALDGGRHVARVEGAGHLQRDDAGAGGRFGSCSCSSASSAPATTIWPPPLKFAGSSPSSSSRAEQLVLVAAERRRSCRSASSAAASAIARPRSATKCIASASAEDAGGRRSGDLADRVAGDAADPVARGRRRAGGRSVRRPAATMSGWAIAVSRIVSASLTVPWVARSTPAASE